MLLQYRKGKFVFTENELYAAYCFFQSMSIAALHFHNLLCLTEKTDKTCKKSAGEHLTNRVQRCILIVPDFIARMNKAENIPPEL